jgi:hypothetical protein
MDKNDIKRRVFRRIDEDDQFADNVEAALDAGDDAWLLALIIDVVGAIIEIGSSIWNWLRQQFS